MKLQSLDDVVLRTATNEDRNRIVAHVFGILAEYGLPPDPESKDADLEDIEAHYLRSGGALN